MNTAEYNQFVYAYAGYNAQDRALDARTQSYANSQFFAKLPAGSYKLVFECVNGAEDGVIWYKSILEEDPYMALVDDSNTVIVSDNTFNQITGRPQWTQKIYTFTVNDETNVGLFYKLYPNNFRAYIVPDDTEFVAFTNSQFIETGHPTFSGTTGWAPYGKTGYDWASVQAQVQSDWAQSDNTAVDYIKNKPNLATVATTGDYDDLTNKPTIPDALPTHTVSNLNDVLSVDSNNHVVWRDCREVPSYGPAMNGRELKVVTTGQTTSLEWVVPSEVPAVGSGDDGKVLTADYTGGTGSYSWETPATPADMATQTWVGQQGFLTSADEVPTVTSGDDGKVLTADYTGGVASYSWETVPTPADMATQTWVGQQGFLTSADEVPAVGSSDDGKVLTASYSGGQGSYSWETPSGGGGGLQVETDGTNYWITVNGIRLYFASSAPTGTIPDGSLGIGW